MFRSVGSWFLGSGGWRFAVCPQGSPAWWETRREFSPDKGSPKQPPSSWKSDTGSWPTKRADSLLGPSTRAHNDSPWVGGPCPADSYSHSGTVPWGNGGETVPLSFLEQKKKHFLMLLKKTKPKSLSRAFSRKCFFSLLMIFWWDVVTFQCNINPWDIPEWKWPQRPFLLAGDALLFISFMYVTVLF